MESSGLVALKEADALGEHFGWVFDSVNPIAA